MVYNARGEYVYGPRDEIDFNLIREAGLPFSLAGGFSTPEKVKEALGMGADSVTVATIFQYCTESALRPEEKQASIDAALRGELDVYGDTRISPTGFVFKTLRNVPGAPSIGDAAVYSDWSENRRDCTIGRLRDAYTTPRGIVGWRCPAEPIKDYVRKGGKLEDTVGVGCMCEMLQAAVGLGQVHKDGYEVPPLYSTGTMLDFLRDNRLMQGRRSYSARDVIKFLVSGLK